MIVTARALRAVARYLAARQHSHAETVILLVQIDDPDGTRHEETLTYTAAPGQSTVEAAATALRALPGVRRLSTGLYGECHRGLTTIEAIPRVG